jgi:hypothetical protein
MSNTGVGGIKDSQGNFEIVGKSNSTLGTRGGALLVPVGDVIGQTSGTLAVNVYTASTLTDPDTLTLNVQEFVPGTPPSVPLVISSLKLSKDKGSFTVDAFPILTVEPKVISGSIGGALVTALSGQALVFDATNAIAPEGATFVAPNLTMITVLNADLSNASLSQSFVMPFGGDIVDVIVVNPDNGSTTTVQRVVPAGPTFPVTTLVAGAALSLLRLSTFGNASGTAFDPGDTITISTTAAAASPVRVCVHIIRTTPVS